MLDPGDCGGEPLLAASASGARCPSSSRQQSQKEEVLRSRRAPRSAAISCPRAAAAAAAPRSPRLLLSRAPQTVPRCRHGSGGGRRCSSPARPARPLSREGRLEDASLLQLRDAQGEKRSEPGLVREAGADAHLSAALGRGLYIGPQRKPIGLREET